MSYKKKKNKFKKLFTSKIFWGVFLSLIIIGTFGYSLFFSHFFTIKKAIVSPKQDLTRSIEKRFYTNLGKNFWFFNKKKVKENILERYPEIKSAEISKKLPSSISLSFKRRNPVGFFCKDKDSCFLIDKSGIIFKKKEKTENLFSINSQEKKNLKLGERLVQKERMEKFIRIEEKLEEGFNIRLGKVIIWDNKKVEIETNEGWCVYFDFTKDLNLTLTKLQFLLQEKIPPEERENIEYIDLRFSKAYYK